MDPLDLLEDSSPSGIGTPAPKRSGGLVFDLTFNLGHIFILLSFILTGGLFYADKVSHTAVIAEKVDVLEKANLPIRMQSLESTTVDLHLRMVEIQDKLNTKQDKSTR